MLSLFYSYLNQNKEIGNSFKSNNKILDWKAMAGKYFRVKDIYKVVADFK